MQVFGFVSFGVLKNIRISIWVNSLSDMPSFLALSENCFASCGLK